MILNNINLEIETDKITGIVGNNGVGKTTFFRVLSGVYQAAHGNMYLHEQRLAKSDIAFLPTEPFFYSYMRGYEYIELVCNISKSQIHDTYIQELNLPLDELIENYSTGMKKKIAFAAMHQLQKPVMILDEPFNGVDLESNEILKYIIQNSREKRVTLISSHILSTLLDVCDKIIYVKDNFIIEIYQQDEFHKLQSMLQMKIRNKFTEDK